ncbi:hypothetical protein G6F60_015451 [Rhizopus arrhizus]|nr:hypothetical protein G6F60_015451 [Rhizopus arrhizus]
MSASPREHPHPDVEVGHETPTPVQLQPPPRRLVGHHDAGHAGAAGHARAGRDRLPVLGQARCAEGRRPGGAGRRPAPGTVHVGQQ